MKIDVHQHIWTQPLVDALSERREFPFVARKDDLTLLYLAGERPYVIDVAAEEPTRRGDLVERDGLDTALVCLSSPLGIEWLPREEALRVLEAYHDGVLSLDSRFGAWGALPLRTIDPEDVDRALDRGCVGVSLPAGAIGTVDALAGVHPLLERLEQRDAPLLVHPGPGLHARCGVDGGPSLGDPLWWPALTSYVAGMQAAWLAFRAAGRSTHPRLRVVFTMLAGLAPLQTERLSSRGGPTEITPDPLVFYDTSSYGHAAIGAVAAVVGSSQILYGSDRPVVDPGEHGLPSLLDWDAMSDGTRRAFPAQSFDSPPPPASPKLAGTASAEVAT